MGANNCIDKKELSQLMTTLWNMGINSFVAEPVSDGTKIQAIDNQQTTEIILRFEHEFAKDKAFINLEKFRKMVRSLGGNDVCVEFTERQTILSNDTQKITLTNHSINTVPKFPKVPEVNEPSIIMEKADFEQFAKHANSVSNTFTIHVNTMELTLSASNDDGRDVKLYLPMDMMREFIVHKEISSKYNIKIVKAFLSSIPGEYVHLTFAKDGPIQLTVYMDKYSASLYLAPIVDSEN